MKHGGDCAKRLRHLFNQLVRKYGKPTPPELSDPLEQMLIAILGGNSSHHKAIVAFRRLREQMVDLNELRVTPVSELAKIIAPSVPHAEVKAHRIVECLNDIRRRHDTLDLSFLKQRGRREAREYLESLAGVDRATAASVTLFSLGGHAIPVDELTLQVLRKEEVVDSAADLAEVESFLEHHIGASDALAFVMLLDRHVAARGVRLPEEPAEPIGAEPARPAARSAVEESNPTSAPEAALAPASRDGKSRAAAPNADPSHARVSAPRSPTRPADPNHKTPSGHTADKTGKATKRR